MGNKLHINAKLQAIYSKADIINDVNSFNLMAKLGQILRLIYCFLNLCDFFERSEDFSEYFKFTLTATIVSDISELKSFNDLNGFFRHKRWRHRLLKIIMRISVIKGGDVFHLEICLNEFYKLFDIIYDISSQRIVEASLKKSSSKDRFLSDIKNSEEPIHQNQLERPVSRFSLEKYDETVCEVCFHQRKEIILPCEHSFCENCYEQWIHVKNKSECMICRMILTQDNKNDQFFLIDDPNCARKYYGDNLMEFLKEKNIEL